MLRSGAARRRKPMGTWEGAGSGGTANHPKCSIWGKEWGKEWGEGVRRNPEGGKE